MKNATGILKYYLKVYFTVLVFIPLYFELVYFIFNGKFSNLEFYGPFGLLFIIYFAQFLSFLPSWIIFFLIGIRILKSQKTSRHKKLLLSGTIAVLGLVILILLCIKSTEPENIAMSMCLATILSQVTSLFIYKPPQYHITETP